MTQEAALGFHLTGNAAATAEAPADEPATGETPQPIEGGLARGGRLLQVIQGLAKTSTPQQTANEFRWQQAKSNEATKFRDEALIPSPRPRIFGFLQHKSPYVHTLHSPAKFFDLDTATELQGKIIAFVGDRTAVSQPHPVALPDRNAWEWKTAPIVNDAVAAASFFDTPGNDKELWKPTGRATTPVTLSV